MGRSGSRRSLQGIDDIAPPLLELRRLFCCHAPIKRMAIVPPHHTTWVTTHCANDRDTISTILPIAKPYVPLPLSRLACTFFGNSFIVQSTITMLRYRYYRVSTAVSFGSECVMPMCNCACLPFTGGITRMVQLAAPAASISHNRMHFAAPPSTLFYFATHISSLITLTPKWPCGATVNVLCAFLHIAHCFTMTHINVIL